MILNFSCLICQIDSALATGVCDFCYSILPWYNNKLTDPYNSNLELPSIYTVFSYQEPIRKLILDLKFKQKLIYADFLGNILAKQVINNWYQANKLPALIIPVPLHAARLRSRGFNQAFELAKTISKITKIPINSHACSRIKNTFNQSSLLKQKRKANIQHAFKATKILASHIAIIDDVVTTGSTVKALKKAILTTNDNITIDIWCVCKA